ncbi:unnamed protein product [Ostreobium quekettii]|uniref:Pentacotripeptide-repeat region of PRORP domain-containing protein n=1 Tax=Ostreobium quekettii TaxID=121088 RepID=A0A8S1IPL6_9CHLO|nr:unnamed protein product [Ostreobium quekettii]|eukprot:evm.model.scf_280EXC.13 EVM.evm.TU.scf_280EXC.13   scf_280EXC:70494-75968(-)
MLSIASSFETGRPGARIAPAPALPPKKANPVSRSAPDHSARCPEPSARPPSNSPAVSAAVPDCDPALLPGPSSSGVVAVGDEMRMGREVVPVGKAGRRLRRGDEGGRSARWQAAAARLEEASAAGVPPPREACNAVLQGQCQNLQFNKPWRTYCELKNKFPDDMGNLLSYQTYHILMSAALQAGDDLKAVEVFRDLPMAGFEANVVTHCQLISGLLKCRRRGTPNSQQAYQLWQELSLRGDLDAGAYKTGCNACIAAGKLEEAEKLITTMRVHGLRPDVKMYNIVLKGRCKIGNMDSAVQWLQMMEQADLQPTRVTYNTLVNGFVDNGQMAKAQAMLEEADIEGIPPDVWSYTALMKGHLKDGRLDKMEQCIVDLEERGGKPNLVTFGVLIDGYVSIGNMEMVEATLQRMRQLGIKPNVVIYNTLLKGLAASGKASVEDMFGMLDDMASWGLVAKADTYNIILQYIIARGQYSAVEGIFHRMIEAEVSPDAISYTLLLGSTKDRGMPVRGRRVFEQLQGDGGADVDVAAWSAFASCLVSAGMMDTAEQAAKDAVACAKERGEAVPLKAFGAIIDGYSRQGNVHKAIAMFRQFYKLGGQPDLHMFESLMELCLRCGENEPALSILRALQFSGLKVDMNKYTSWFEDADEGQFKGNSAQSRELSTSIERLKFWVGLPNGYYDTEWP